MNAKKFEALLVALAGAAAGGIGQALADPSVIQDPKKLKGAIIAGAIVGISAWLRRSPLDSPKPPQ